MMIANVSADVSFDVVFQGRSLLLQGEQVRLWMVCVVTGVQPTHGISLLCWSTTLYRSQEKRSHKAGCRLDKLTQGLIGADAWRGWFLAACKQFTTNREKKNVKE